MEHSGKSKTRLLPARSQAGTKRMISLPLPLACTAGKLAPTNEVLGSYGPFNRIGGISGTSQLAAREIIRLTCKGNLWGVTAGSRTIGHPYRVSGIAGSDRDLSGDESPDCISPSEVSRPTTAMLNP